MKDVLEEIFCAALCPTTRMQTSLLIEDRLSPLEILQAGDEGRIPELIPIRYGRMLKSPFTFFRGAAAIMAADLASTPDIKVRVQACGDCHALNFGAFATPERNVVFDLNDFDETLPASMGMGFKKTDRQFGFNLQKQQI